MSIADALASAFLAGRRLLPLPRALVYKQQRHAKALPTGAGLSKADRKNLRAKIAKAIARPGKP